MVIKEDFISDVFEGMTDLQLMVKYGLKSVVDLWKIFEHLATLGVVTQQELDKRFPVETFTTHPQELRQTVRNKLFGKVEIYDEVNPLSYTMEILDISEAGVMIAPIEVVTHEIRKFVVRPKQLDDVNNISFTAQCRWTKENKAGFKIIEISPSNMRELQKFIKLFAFEAL